MSENLHDIDDLFRSALDENKETPPPQVWEKINGQLDSKKVIYLSERYRALKRIVAALLILSFSFGIYQWMKSKSPDDLVTSGQKNTSDYGTINRDQHKVNSEKLKTQPDPKTEALNVQPQNDAVASHGARVQPSEGTDTLVSGSRELNETNAGEKENETVRKDPEAVGNDKEALRKESGQKLSGAHNIHSPSTVKREVRNEKKVNAIRTPVLKNVSDYVDKKIPGNDNNQRLSGDAASEPDVRRSLEPGQSFRLLQPPAITGPSIIANHNLQPSISRSDIKVDENIKKLANASRGTSPRATLSITAFYSPELQRNKLVAGRRSYREDDKDEIKQREERVSSYSTGMTFTYNMPNRIGFTSGVYVTSTTTNIKPQVVFARPDPHGNIRYRYNCTSGYTYLPAKAGITPSPGDSLLVAGSKNSLQYVSIPLVVQYNFTAGKFGFHPSAGLGINMLTKQLIETSAQPSSGHDKEKMHEIEGLKPVYTSGLFAFTAEYNLNNNIAISFSPTARLGLNSVNEDAPVKSYTRSFGLATGIVYKF